jgi:hypothetical protein
MWVPINTGLRAIIDSGVLSLALDPRAPSTLYSAIENAGIYKTTDGGASWAAANDDLGAPAVEPDRIYAGSFGDGAFAMPLGSD